MPLPALRLDQNHPGDLYEQNAQMMKRTLDAAGRAFNIGSGSSVSIAEVARALARAMGKDIEPEILDQARAGDIRHCFADVSLAEQVLGFRAQQAFHEGLQALAAWLEAQEAEDKAPEARRELEARGLVAS